ncbi:Ig-like V-type domain-containing protein FAM187A [Pelodytes ibericus]
MTKSSSCGCSPIWVVFSCALQVWFRLVANILLVLFAAESFEIVEKEDIYRVVPCPAFLVFDTAAFLGDMTIELPCHCKPEQINSVVWYYQKSLDSASTRVLTDFNGTTVVDSGNVHGEFDLLLRFSIRMFSLIVFQAQPGDSGHYICGTREGQFFYGYYVDIQPSGKAYITFRDQDGHPQSDLTMKDFTAFTTFWKWTTCDRCDVRGEQWRLGLCYIRSVYLYPRYRVTDDNVASCGSAAVPSRFKTYVADRKPEIVIRSCETPCYMKKKGLFGKIQNLMYSIYKLKDHIPWIPKVPTQVHTHILGENLVIACPGAKPQHAVAWDKDDERLYLTQYLIGINESMRVYIDHGNHLNIRTVQRNDKATYYCWHEGNLKAGFRLSVTRDPTKKRKITDLESIHAMKIIGFSFLCFSGIFVLVHCLRCCFHNFRCIPLMD